MRLIVQKYVYARIEKPSTDVAFSCYRSPGEVITIDDIVIGTEIHGNSIWYHCSEDACYYWSGGFSNTNDLLEKRRNNFSFSHEEKIMIYKSAANELSNIYNNIPGYKGIAVGYKVIEKENRIEDNIALIFYVDQKVSPAESKIKKVINYRGFSLISDVKVLKNVRLHSEDPESQVPYIMGGSIANEEENVVGTRALIVIKAERKYLLTCFHVACSSLFEKNQFKFNNEDFTLHIPSRRVAPYANILNGTVVEGGFGPNYDYALIDLDIKRLSNRMPGHLFNNGHYSIEDLKQLNKDTRLFMYGTTTHGKNGLFRAFHSNDVEIDEFKDLKMSGLIETECMSGQGDSGAPVVDSTNKFLGFIVAGDSVTKTFILPIAQLEFDFHFSPNFL